jgi:hypothetical protein
MRGLLYLGLGVATLILLATSWLSYINYRVKKASLEQQFEQKEKDMEHYVTNIERDLLRKEEL